MLMPQLRALVSMGRAWGAAVIVMRDDGGAEWGCMRGDARRRAKRRAVRLGRGSGREEREQSRPGHRYACCPKWSPWMLGTRSGPRRTGVVRKVVCKVKPKREPVKNSESDMEVFFGKNPNHSLKLGDGVAAEIRHPDVGPIKGNAIRERPDANCLEHRAVAVPQLHHVVVLAVRHPDVGPIK